MLQGSLEGLNPADMLGNVFENPMGSLTDALGSVADVAQGALESAFVVVSSVTDPLTGLVTEVREIGGELAGKLSLEQLDGLKDSIASLSDSLPSYKDLTDKISGVALPDFTQVGDFGLQQVVAIQGSFENLANSIPSELNAQVGDLSSAITDNLGKITEPLNLGSVLDNATSVIDSAVAQLQSVAAQGAGAVQTMYTEIINTVTSAQGLVTGTVAESKSVMGTFINGSQAMGYVESASGALMGGSSMSSGLINQVVKPTPLAQMKEGIAKYAPGTLADVGTVVNPPTF